MKVWNVSGRQYKELKEVHCYECETTARALQKDYLFLSWCNFVECRVLLCSKCKPNHEALHQLANDEEAKPKKWGYNNG